MMSGSILYPPTREDCDVAILFIETSGCLPMCGQGTIGTVTAIIEQGQVRPKTEGMLRLDTPAGIVEAPYERNGDHVERVRIVNVASFLLGRGYNVEIDGLVWATKGNREFTAINSELQGIFTKYVAGHSNINQLAFQELPE